MRLYRYQSTVNHPLFDWCTNLVHYWLRGHQPAHLSFGRLQNKAGRPHLGKAAGGAALDPAAWHTRSAYARYSIVYA
jgi:hypothetical protein